MKHLVIGMGEVGIALVSVLQSGKKHNVGWKDLARQNIPFKGNPHVIHIAFPYNHKCDFENSVSAYEQKYKPKMVIVHSSVPVGTCDGNGWVHSPVRGVHPHLERGIRTFVKYFGGTHSVEASAIFKNMGIEVRAWARARDTEAGKLWDTTQYGMMIVINKLIRSWCDTNGVDYDKAYGEFNKSYNDGYASIGRTEVLRPHLNYMPGPIGGHCVIPNLSLLGKNQITDLINLINDQESLAISGEQQ